MSDGTNATAATPADPTATSVVTPAAPAPAAGAPASAEGGGELPAGAAAPAAAPDNQPAAEPPKGGLEKRFSELTRKAREAERVAAEERAAREAAEARLQAMTAMPPEADLVPPTFETPEQFQRDMAVYTQQLAERASRDAVQAEQARQAEEQARKTQQAHVDGIRASFQERVEAARPELQDYDDVVNNPDLPISVPLAAAIAQHPLGPKLAYHLGKNLGEAARIAKMPVALQLMELGDLARTLKNPTPNVSTAPPPITPVRGGAPSEAQNFDGMSMEEYAASRNRR